MLERIGRYHIKRELGRGATATVYLARDPESDQRVAIKLMRLGMADGSLSRRLIKLFQTESGVGKRLEHPHIARVYDSVVEEVAGEKRAYLVMEYVAGPSLEQFCQIDRLLPLHRVVGIVFKCCLALDYAFRQGVVHRDIKPANILLDAQDNPKITDFGLALNLAKDKDRDSTFVMGVGSPSYMSPEQVKNYPLNHKTDLYSLGVVLFQLLTGRLPYRAKNPGALVYKIVNMEPPSICALNPALPAGLDPILTKALEKDLYNRYRNGAEFAKDLAAVRYQILEEDDTARDQARFEQLRQLAFFKDFEDVELWEILRISSWREIPEKVRFMREGEQDRVFGIISRGYVEVSRDGRAICRLGAGEVLGEMAFLHPGEGERSASVVTLEPTLFMEIKGAALSLASEELQARVQTTLIARVVDRLRAANGILARFGDPAVEDSGKGVKDYAALNCDLELLPPDALGL